MADRGGRHYAEDREYPPPPEDDEERARQIHLPPLSKMATTSAVTLPSIHDPYDGVARYPPPPPDARGDVRARGDYSASPTSVNGYNTPATNGYLPAPAQGPPRSPYGNEPARDYYAQRPPYGPVPDHYPPYHGARAPPPPPPAQAHYPYQYPVDYRAGAAPPPPQAAPRQRTSIACRYCRKRKIRCSGYQNTPDGKCTNCKKTGNECVFQPVSSSSTTAFVPVSAVPGGVPPGTPLYGAFGQPLAPSGGGPPGPPGPHQVSYPPGPPSAGSDYPLPSPTGSGFYPPPDDRAPHGTRRPRPQEDEQAMRLPPPQPYHQDDDSRRRSPASMQNSTPPGRFQPYPPRGGENEKPSSSQRNSPVGSAGPAGGQSVMSLGHLVDHPPAPSGRDIDKNMLGRLDRRS